MRGCIFKRVLPSGKISWGYSIDAGKDEAGKRERIFKSGFRRQSDAEGELTRLLQEKNDGLLVKPTPETFGTFMQEWFKEHAEQRCEKKTVERYRQLVRYVLPHLEGVPLRELSALTLERVYNQLRKAGGKRKRRLKAGEKSEPAPLSAKTVRNIAGLVHIALSSAVRWKLLRVNPADACELPKLQRREARALDPSQTEWYLDSARGHWLSPILVMAAATGCRRGELLALTWPDLMLDGTPACVKVSKSLEQTKEGLRIKRPKNEKARSLTLPTIAVDALRQHWEKQQEWRAQYGPDYRKDLNLVFATPEGNYLKPDSITAKACLLAKKAGLKGIGLHSLRHSHGSQLLSAGVPLPTVSKRLGHSNVAVTAQVYSHAFSKDEIAAADAWDTAMRTATEAEKQRKRQ